MTRKFLILSLPRSRSKWLSEFLSYGGLRVGHDLIVGCGSVEDFKSALRPLAGSCETGGMVGWKLVRQLMPEIRLVVVRRPVGEVVDSFARLGLRPEGAMLEERAAMLDACSRAEGVVTYPYAGLSSFWVCKELFESCTGLGLEEDWWRSFASRNIQIDMGKRLAEISANREGLDRFAAEVVGRVAALGSASSLGLN